MAPVDWICETGVEEGFGPLHERIDMKRSLRVAAAFCAVAVITLGMSSLLAAPPVSRPAPRPPVLCGCICPDGSFVTTHAKNAKQCDKACATACESASGEF
jgi:hypothetical protein